MCQKEKKQLLKFEMSFGWVSREKNRFLGAVGYGAGAGVVR